METIEIDIPVDEFILKGNLTIPKNANSLVIFSHGSGSSRFSTRNNFVARILNQSKIATLLTDLLTMEEDEIYENRFDIELLTQRLITVTNYASELPILKKLPVGYFGASTGAASALKAAARLKHMVKAIVSRGGRPDLALDDLKLIEAPTLLIVGSRDHVVIELNEQAYKYLTCYKKLEIIDGATHLFEEPGKLEEVAYLASKWFTEHIANSKNKSHAIHR
ncbi:dienelactone hydrolase family protein [Flavobacterium taihuense]|uniref:Alpha/beta hydrolase n=1 Tax=Flavobacterium taihuense TaxID=2857508 RepID=A0ABS6XSL0_9FLAO|nr:alpha/beta hydrolase [Flavobacterium taihuense]MBW4359624.1 alpha/beta hydrolase [Flavobacterium taihuense]